MEPPEKASPPKYSIRGFGDREDPSACRSPMFVESASRTTGAYPSSASPRARSTVTVLFPAPPFPNNPTRRPSNGFVLIVLYLSSADRAGEPDLFGAQVP